MNKTKKGISLIVLVITIIVMSILAASVLIALDDTNIISKANAAVNDYNKKQNDILAMLESVDDYLAGVEEEDKTIIDSQGTVGINGEITLPVLLNDASKIYVLDIQSALYTGSVALNVYNLNDTYVSVVGLTSSTSYPTESRHILMCESILNSESTDQTESGETTEPPTLDEILDELFGTSGMVPMSYESTGTTGKIVYDVASVGSEIRVNSISQIDREYTNFAKLLLKWEETGKLTSSDYAECIRFCINSGILGYDYVNEYYASSNSSETMPEFDESLELQTLTNILNNRMNDVAMLEQTILDQITISLIMFIENLSKEGLPLSVNDSYTFANYFQENEMLNEFFVRSIGNTYVPFTLLYSDIILTDLNEDGVLGGTYQAAVQELAQYLPDTGHAGVGIRNMADVYIYFYPFMKNSETAASELSILEQYELMELMLAIIGEGTQDTFTPVLPWVVAYQLYGEKEMDTMYTLIHETGATINLAGLKMGWNSIVSPEVAAIVGMPYTYDLRNDTEALTKQQVSGIANELYEYVEYSKTLPKETTESGTTE